MSVEFRGRDFLIGQIESSQICPNYGNGLISLEFVVDMKVDKFPYEVRNPVEMRAFQVDTVPVVILLHVINGYVSELEIFNADSSNLSTDFSVENVEWIINPELMLR